MLRVYVLRSCSSVESVRAQELLKYSEADEGGADLQSALDTMLCVVKHVNDIMHQISIKGFEVVTINLEK